MNDIIYDKLDEVLLTIRNNKKVIRMKELKKKIENDVDLKNKLNKFHFPIYFFDRHCFCHNN